ncbi:MAG: hypothetical protein ACRDT9_16735, partial [Agromyces sp.]
VVGLLIPQSCAPVIQMHDGADRCGYPDSRPAVAIVALIALVIAALIAGLGSGDRPLPRSSRVGLSIALSGSFLATAAVFFLAFRPPWGAPL